jgi:N-methylhydantoinase B/oxoprolinase/acetone carboxylase alpha subunit
MGAGAKTDGVSTCIFPSSASNVPVELFEVAVPLVIEEKEFLTNSAGPGRQRGGLGQRMSFRLLTGFEGTATVALQPMGQHVPPFGLNGAGEAMTAEIMVDGRVLTREEKLTIAGAMEVKDTNVLVSMDTAGGGGFGPAEERNAALVADDVRNGLISADQAMAIYGVVLDLVTFKVNTVATAERRRALAAARKKLPVS